MQSRENQHPYAMELSPYRAMPKLAYELSLRTAGFHVDVSEFAAQFSDPELAKEILQRYVATKGEYVFDERLNAKVALFDSMEITDVEKMGKQATTFVFKNIKPSEKVIKLPPWINKVVFHNCFVQLDSYSHDVEFYKCNISQISEMVKNHKFLSLSTLKFTECDSANILFDFTIETQKFVMTKIQEVIVYSCVEKQLLLDIKNDIEFLYVESDFSTNFEIDCQQRLFKFGVKNADFEFVGAQEKSIRKFYGENSVIKNAFLENNKFKMFYLVAPRVGDLQKLLDEENNFRAYKLKFKWDCIPDVVAIIDPWKNLEQEKTSEMPFYIVNNLSVKREIVITKEEADAKLWA